MPPALRRALTVAAIVLLLGGSGAAGFLAWRGLQAPAPARGTVETGCDLQRGACAARFADGGTLEVELTPRPVPLLNPLTVEVRLTGIAAGAVEVDFRSPDMYMGYNRRTLAREADGRYTGRAVLPACVRERMRWQLEVTAGTAQGARAARFEFETVTARTGD